MKIVSFRQTRPVQMNRWMDEDPVSAKDLFLNAYIFRIRIPKVNEVYPQYSVGRTLSTNLVYTIWAVFGGFILHFLLSNFLTVLLRRNFAEQVDTAADLIRRDITPILPRSYKIYVDIFANSPDPIYRNLSQKLYICKHKEQYINYKNQMIIRKLRNVAIMQSQPSHVRGTLYFSKEVVKGRYHFPGSIANKKWPLKKVF